MRSYIVIPEGTPIVRVDASGPHYAASKARRGKGEHVNAGGAVVLPESATVAITDEGPSQIPGQLCWADDGELVEA